VPVDSLSTVSSSWTSNRAVSLHVAMVVFLPACAALTWWQASRALSGNTLSWVYTFEWPIFAAYAGFMWWKLVHDEPAPGVDEGPEAAGGSGTSGVSGSPDPARPGAPTGAGAGAGARAGAGAGADREAGEPDDELAAYNRYLAELNASGKQKRW
jgi:hypothetical protein